MTRRTTTVGLVLGAGGTPGGVFIRAALAELAEITGWSPDHADAMVGTSVGALNVARLALREQSDPTPGMLQSLHGLATGLMPPDDGPLDQVISPIRIGGGAALARFAPVGKHHADYEVAEGDFRSNVRVVSVSRRTGKRRIAELSEASNPTEELYASAAIPGFSKPRTIDGVEYVDGAVWSTTNADLLKPTAVGVLVVIAPMVPRSGGSLAQRGHRATLARELADWTDAGQSVVCVLPTIAEIEEREDHKRFSAAARAHVRGAAKP